MVALLFYPKVICEVNLRRGLLHGDGDHLQQGFMLPTGRYSRRATV